MRWLIVHPGHINATKDVYDGLTAALTDQGVEVVQHNLRGRLQIAEEWLKFCDRRLKEGPDRLWKSLSNQERINAIASKACEEIVTRALRYNVDGVLIITAMYAIPDMLLMLQRAGIPVGIYFTESPYDDDRHRAIAHLVDICWTNNRSSVSYLRQVQPSTFYLPSAYNPSVHKTDPSLYDERVPAHDVVFVATMFPERAKLLSEIDWTGIDLGLYGFMLGNHGINKNHPLAPYVKSGVIENSMAAALYRRAKIGLNLYRDHPNAQSCNPRAYELAACGCFQISQWRDEVQDVFGTSVPMFKTPTDLNRLIRVCLFQEDYDKHWATRNRLSSMTFPTPDAYRQNSIERAMTRVKDETYGDRALQLVEQFGAVIAGDEPEDDSGERIEYDMTMEASHADD